MVINMEFLKGEDIYLKLDKKTAGNIRKQWLPAYHFTICDMHGDEVGGCDLRIGYNKNAYYGGNIGYHIDENYRGHHYAGKACLLLFQLAKKHKMDYLIITCNPDNHASRKTCEYAGGTLEEIVEIPEDNDMRKIGETEKCIYRFSLLNY
ncbi:acetyltransferase (GNAT) family protein [Lacrimispora xylanisolvens]|uniref:Acetyltransferase (GNAT) family protein n=1 Tax=Lacrimispora xylanisolvens TaxID=384636 RepID=A0A2S6HLR5_9FIRM|nr:GNAT family N-acetyltransferase [Hungatella xylanolytica]MBE5989797.1 GNAT family N-acetyltransferase [Paenibacillaceae bacterium]MBE5995672.1 GNAT family N-acetyltransferase [Paenibacillaceae bacterium]PPK78418.1 acetyltransferase (GNAT) family protein [Hungatella xylanolytica]